MDGAPKVVGMGSGSTAGAAAGTAILGPGIGTAVGGIVGSFIKTGSPRYEGGPLISTVQNALAALRDGDQSRIAYTEQDRISGGVGWKDVALVLAPVVRPDLFPGGPSRPLNAQEQALVAPYVAYATGTTTAARVNPTTFGAGGGGASMASMFGGVSPVMLAFGAAAVFLASRSGKRSRR